jgi:formamidopyrimidine-DNA glycosylase
MLELPQPDQETDIIGHSLCGKQIVDVVITKRTHRLTSYYDHPENYPKQLLGKTIQRVSRFRGILQIKAGDTLLIFSDRIKLTYCQGGAKPPAGHRLLLCFEDASCLAASADIYGAIWCYKEDELIHPYFGVHVPEL